MADINLLNNNNQFNLNSNTKIMQMRGITFCKKNSYFISSVFNLQTNQILFPTQSQIIQSLILIFIHK
jgi:hypothetical protein